jgi:aminopeptidase N
MEVSARSLGSAMCALGLALVMSACRTQRCLPGPALSESRTQASAVGAGAVAPTFLQFDVKLALDIDNRSLNGETIISIDFRAPGSRELTFVANGLAIDGVTLGGNAVAHRIEAKNLVVVLPPGATSPERLTFRYHGTPARGLVFGESFVYSDYFTCWWMICRDEPGDKAPLRLELEVPARYRVAASGHPTRRELSAGERARWTWIEERPYSPYLFGFAAGEFAEAAMLAGSTKLRFLGASETPDSLLRKLGDTPRVLQFFHEKAGVSFPQDVYTQVVVPGGEAQEKSSFSILGKENLDPILDDPQEDSVMVHELAHQWWGNLVTCRSWAHFWLNEGMTSFMVAAYKQQRWGKGAYDREIALFRERHQRAVDASFDVPLAYSKAYPSLRIKRAITYAKGALFLHTLREKLGDAPFWSGIRRYTQEHAGKTVETRDFQRAMVAASGTDLTALFRAWADE